MKPSIRFWDLKTKTLITDLYNMSIKELDINYQVSALRTRIYYPN